MKKLLSFAVLAALLLSLTGCAEAKKSSAKWDCTVTCMETSTAEAYVITYSEQELRSSTGTLSFQNPSDFPVVLHLLTAGENEQVFDIPPGGACAFLQAKPDAVYTAGLHADVPAGTEIPLIAYDGTEQDPYP